MAACRRLSMGNSFLSNFAGSSLGFEAVPLCIPALTASVTCGFICRMDKSL